MLVKNNYQECLTNLACSIQRYFGIQPKHNSIKEIDELLNSKKPENVVIILFDGMGSRILDRSLNQNDFFIKNKRKEITTVFPATTTAATNSIRTGLNPIEHGWLGWNMYIAPIDETITLFLNLEKGKNEPSAQFLKVKNKLTQRTIVNEINENSEYSAIEISPFSENKYNDLDEMLNMIKQQCALKGKKYIYAYDVEPDHTMHDLGPDDDKIKELIKIRSDKVEKMCEELKDTIVFVIADHGHKAVEPVHLEDYPQLMNMLARTTSLEQRAVSFKIKEGYKEQFIKEFNQIFGKDFKLYEREDVIKSQLFGDGEENELFFEAIGDFIAIADETNKCIVTKGDMVLKSQHAGYSDDEVYVPLIIIDRTNK